MSFRKLRIAWSVVCGIACVSLIALWVRSYWWCDIIEGPLTRSSGFRLASQSGDVSCSKYPGSKAEWAKRSIEMDVIRSRLGWNPSGFYWSWELGPIIQIPHWFLLGIIATLAVLPWRPCRFSLRTLLIATTLVASVLGLVVAVLRWPAG
jgi:hypothetical protein